MSGPIGPGVVEPAGTDRGGRNARVTAAYLDLRRTTALLLVPG